MKNLSPHSLIFFLFFMAGSCGAEITGKVIDAETQQPIEGALILVEWTIAKGLPGMSQTEPHEIEEVLSKKDGSFKIKTYLNPFLDNPRITIYKKAYVAWNNEYIFPGWTKRDKFELRDGMSIRLEPFKKEYSRADHVSFLNSITHWGKQIGKAYRWEELEKEQNR